MLLHCTQAKTTEASTCTGNTTPRVVTVASALGVVTYLWTMGIRGELHPAFRVVAGLGALVFALAPFILKLTGSLTLVGNVFVLALFALPVSVMAGTGGEALAVLFSMCFVPLLAVLIGGRRAGAV